MKHDPSTVGHIVRTMLAETVAMAVLKEKLELRETVIADLKLAMADMIKGLKKTGDPRAGTIIDALPAKLDEQIAEIRAL